MEVFDPGEGHAGDEQNQAQLGPGVPQQIHRDGVRPQNHRRSHGQQEEKEDFQTGGDGLVGGPAVAQGQMLGGEVGHRRGQPHGGEGQDHRIHRHHQLIQPHDLRPHHAGQDHPEAEAQQLGHRAQGGEKQRAPAGRQHFFRQVHPPSSTNLFGGRLVYPFLRPFAGETGHFGKKKV